MGGKGRRKTGRNETRERKNTERVRETDRKITILQMIRECSERKVGLIEESGS